MDFIKGENEFDTTFMKAMDEIDSNWRSYNGVVVLGSHFPSAIEEKLEKIRFARKNKIPFLGICFGLQLAVIEFARNVLGIKSATSEEFGEQIGTRVVEKMLQMRVGVYPVYWPDGVISFENFWHNYKVSPEVISKLKDYFQLNEYQGIVEAIRLNNHPFFCAFQFHPEYSSSREEPHPILKDFIKNSKLCGIATGPNL